MNYTSSDVIRITGVTYRQLDYWCRTGRLGDRHKTDHGSGNERHFTAADVMLVAYTATLLQAGFALDAALSVAAQLVEQPSKRVELAAGMVVVDLDRPVSAVSAPRSTGRNQ